MLVDFDWCGAHGKATYPINLNDSGVDWADGVQSGELMLKEHDCRMLEELRAYISID